ncbi:MAG: hypothetical protein HGB10_06220 [Coriobacteriia bacterium]|nr:hypothetical protein [Coriobacteriia bacterium]
MQESTQHSEPTHEAAHPSIGPVLGVLAAVLIGGMSIWHLAATSAHRASTQTGITARARYERAFVASALEPFDPRFSAREALVASWLRAQTLLAAGDYNAAMHTLESIVGRTHAEPDLLLLYREAQATQTAETNRKAHLQHGHEGPGGTLTPGDIER